MPDLPVSEANLQKVWNDYTEIIKNENPHFYNIIANRKPTLTNNIEVNLELLAQSQETELIKEKDKLFDFLKNKLQNSQLKLKTFISKDKQPEITEAITASDILKVMMTKNSTLIKLTNELNLEIE